MHHGLHVMDSVSPAMEEAEHDLGPAMAVLLVKAATYNHIGTTLPPTLVSSNIHYHYSASNCIIKLFNEREVLLTHK